MLVLGRKEVVLACMHVGCNPGVGAMECWEGFACRMNLHL